VREILETIADELRRESAEGDGYVPLDDEALAVLRKLASSAGGESGDFVDDVEEVKFAAPSAVNLSEIKEESKKVKIVKSGEETSDIPNPKPFELPEGGKQERWEALKNIVLSDAECARHLRPEKKIVFGVGNLDAKIFFCGEAPGADEEVIGEPFVGKAGQLLTKIIAAMGLSRSDVYIGNIMNWRPECPRGNRPPTEDEMRYCLPYLKAQIEIVQPRVVVALGMTAVNGLLGFDPARRMGKIRGKWQSYGVADLMITYHPSFLLQYASAQMKRYVWEDMMAVMERVGIPISEKQRGYFLPK